MRHLKIKCTLYAIKHDIISQTVRCLIFCKEKVKLIKLSQSVVISFTSTTFHHNDSSIWHTLFSDMERWMVKLILESKKVNSVGILISIIMTLVNKLLKFLDIWYNVSNRVWAKDWWALNPISLWGASAIYI